MVDEPERSSIAGQVLMNNPLTAAGEMALNLGSQAVALPVAGLAGLATEAGNALGLTEQKGADVVHAVGEALTYQPRGEMGKAAAGIVAYPFEKLNEAATFAGEKTREATDSPLAATAVHTLIEGVAPLVVGPAAKAVKGRIPGKVEAIPEGGARDAQAPTAGAVVPEAAPAAQSAAMRVSGDPAQRGFHPLKEAGNGITDQNIPQGVRRAQVGDSLVYGPDAPELSMVRGPGDNGLPGVDGQFRGIPDARRAEAEAQSLAVAREVGREQGIRAGERGVVAASEANHASSVLPQDAVRGAGIDLGGNQPGTRLGARRIENADSSLGDGAGQGFNQRAGAISENRGVADAQRANDVPARMGKESRNSAGEAAESAGSRLAAGEGIAAGRLSEKTGFQPLNAEVQPMAGKVQNSWAPGANYAPLIDDAKSPAGAASVADLPDPIRRENIIKDFTKALDSTIYEGRVKGKNRLGFFRPGVEEVRIKRFNDIEVASHEMAHLIDHRVPELSKVMKADKALRDELRSVSYDRNNIAEGFAEGVRLWMTQPETLQARAPKVAAFLDDFAATHAYGPALRKAQADMTGWFGQDALNRARSKIGQEKPLAEFFDRAFDKLRQSTVDDLHGIYQMERDMSGGKIAASGAYETARLSRASASIADGAIRFGYPVKKADRSFTYAGKGLEEILRPVAGSLDDVLLYFVGRSARELMQQGREHLFTKAEIKGMLDLRTPERDAAFKEYQAWNKGILDFAEAQGVLNPETRKQWKRTEYLPFHRVQQPGSLKGKPGDWAGVKALTGGTDNIRDVLGNMIGNAAQLVDVAVKNEARLKVAELASRPGGAKFMVKVDAESRPVKVSGNQVMDEMLKRYGIAIDGQPPAFFEFFLSGQPPAGGNVVAVLKGGKPVWYEVGDPILYRALSSLDRAPMHWLTQWLGMPKRIGQATITLTPDFMVANIARDTIMGAVMSRSGFRPVIDSLQGMRLRLKNDPLYKEYIANGGGLSSLYLDEHHLRTKLEKFYSKQGIDYRTVLDTPDKLLSAVETMADAFEMSTRLGEYKRAIDAGEHPRHAAFQGREVSTDFAMKGDSKALGFMYDTVMFLRPAVVSMDRLYRGVAHDPNRVAIGLKTGMIALSSVGLYLLNREDPRYADLPDWDRDTHWHFFVGDQHFRYPKIWEIGAVASSAERTVERLMESDPAGLGKDFARIIGHTFSLNLMPQIIAPIYEQGANRNSFTKAPIETPGMENVQPFMRAKPNTSETMRALGMASRNMPESLQVNPVRTEALLRGYLNTWAAYGLMMTDKAFFSDAGPTMRTDELPVVRRFYAQEPAKHTKFETKFYDMLGEAKRLQGTMRELDRQGRPEIADEKESSPLAGEAKPLERAQQNIKVVNAEMMKTHRDKVLSPGEKRQRIDELIAEKNRLLKATVLDAEAAQRSRR
ncbi:LPD38 domain-containing protein [Dechloromonas denitrificans]|nr:LPD38 domain-containing protein [Dechloromonas denitrificans]